ncbi:MAG: hypothetical protein EBR15_04810, partial [Gammaproteobacteria bacterium]|nr:hypothetical protein [Gammaproteobacteria bacterium]
GGGVFAHYATHIEHNNFTILLATFAVAYPILGGLKSLAGTLLAVILIQGVMLEGLRFIGEWRSLLFGVLIVVVMLVRPDGHVAWRGDELPAELDAMVARVRGATPP